MRHQRQYPDSLTGILPAFASWGCLEARVSFSHGAGIFGLGNDCRLRVAPFELFGFH